MTKLYVTAKLRLLFLMVCVLMLTACNRVSPVQHHYSTNVGCIVANDFYAIYFSAYVEPEDKTSDSTENREALFKSHCRNIPSTGTVYFTADLVDEDLRETPISLRLVEQEFIGEDENLASDYRDIRTIEEVNSKIYSQGTIEMQTVIESKGHYALYLIVVGGDKPLFEDDILRVPLNVGMGTDATPIWLYILKVTEIIMTFMFPAFVLLLITLPMLPKLRLAVLSKILSGAQSRWS